MVNKLKLPNNDTLNDLNELKEQTEQYTDIILSVTDRIVNRICSGLDKLVSDIRNELSRVDDMSDKDLNYFVAQLPVEMYYVSTQLENVGVATDAATAIRKEKYDHHYLRSEGRTINDKQSDANRAIVNEEMLEVAHQRAYKKIKCKLDYADSILNSLKKVLNYRIAAMELSSKAEYNGMTTMKNRRN